MYHPETATALALAMIMAGLVHNSPVCILLSLWHGKIRDAQKVALILGDGRRRNEGEGNHQRVILH